MMPLKNEDGPVEGFLKILRDRTAQKLAEAALVEAQQELYRAQKVGGVGTFSVDVGSDLLKGSPEFFRMPAAKAVCLELVISSKSMAYVMRYIDFPH